MLNYLRGFSIVLVIFGHSLAAVIENASFAGRLGGSIFAKIATPSVFIFIYLLGYGQGLKRKRVTYNSVIKRTYVVITPYIFWGTLSLILYSILGEPFNQPYTVRDAMGSLTPFSYIITMITFTGSWQYYFLLLILAFQAFGYLFRNIPQEKLEKITRILFFLHIIAMFWLTMVMWFKNPSDFNLTLVGSFIYPNPIFWFFPFMWGYMNGAGRKKQPWESFSRKTILIYLPILVICVVEFMILGKKWGAFFLIDQFTLSSFFLNICALKIMGYLAGRMKDYKGKFLSSFFSTFGMYSFVAFLIHLPFQWFFLVCIEKAIGMQLPFTVQFLSMAIFGVLFSYLIISISSKLPKLLRKLFIGF